MNICLDIYHTSLPVVHQRPVARALCEKATFIAVGASIELEATIVSEQDTAQKLQLLSARVADPTNNRIQDPEILSHGILEDGGVKACECLAHWNCPRGGWRPHKNPTERGQSLPV
jgi:hypothetical protein